MRLAILGRFGFKTAMFDGQTVKTKNLADCLKKYKHIEPLCVDTHGWIRKPYALLKNIKNAFRQCDCVIMLPAHNGVKICTPIMLYYKNKYNKKIYYDVIGGWLPEFLNDKPNLAKNLKQFDGIWVETNTMKNNLDKMGFTNVSVVPNFKNLTSLTENELIYHDNPPFKLCTFSRVMKEKGIEDAAEAVKIINEQLKYTAFTLDIYGKIDDDQKDWFIELQKQFPEYIKYMGCVDSDKSVEVLKEYFALLFPTKCYTEGIPGTIIDTYFAGVPVISSKWESFSDLVDDGKTGIGYRFGDTEDLQRVLFNVANSPNIILEMKLNCLKESKKYNAENVINTIADKLSS